ncbi:glutamate--cysteine ligase [Steroidobacter sp. S1-65]|uniref:Glutamate--cysteine ligase n=1 Tax=Steroidobacter gossypii TaxID=2805490 RepID=A0ABS1WU51_9GAMM|nr:glutamate--cysteine ligase [Steroidobacter gossypii]MBM0104483.1 glutamate--cysteine ligase [Steroidobacter gossypii]
MSSSGIDRAFERRLATLINTREPRVLQNGLKGVEKESLRVSPDGRIEHSPHPQALGSALSHEHITTDYSEALLELVTPAFRESWQLLQYLCDLHQFVYRHLGEQLLWATSMPCMLEGDADIPIARYGRSNIGRMKEVYRLGLGHRYGRMMQAISGVHFNYSFPQQFWPVLAEALQKRNAGQDFISDQYFGLLRNYRRHGWLILYLFGNSPALCESFVRGRDHQLEKFAAGTLYAPHATSLRMSDLGYRNKSQAGVQISVNGLDEYVRDLTAAVSTPHPEYQKLGVKVDGEYRQLNTNLLQIENEYYSYIRPKRVARSGEHPSQALRRGGVEYVEFRALDVSAFDPVGVNQNKLRFLEAFAALCVLKQSDPIEASEQAHLDANHAIVARRGREPGLKLNRNGRSVELRQWALELIDSMRGICELLDEGDERRQYTAALELQQTKIDDPDRTPSARSLQELRTTGESFAQFALRMSRVHKAYFLDLYPPNEQRLAEFSAEAEESLQRQAALEAADDMTFDQFLVKYFAG